MSAFSPTDAAFEGFRLTREQPRVVAAWAALYGIMALATALVMFSTIGPELATLRAAARGSQSTDPAAAMRQFKTLAPFYAVILPFVLAFWSVMTCAVYRAVLRPQEGGVGRLRFGADELRMIGLFLVLVALMIATVFLGSLFVTLGGILAAVGGGAVAGLLTALVGLVGFGAAVWIWVRLSLAGPMTFVTGEIHVFRSWSLTKGHVWPLIGTYLLSSILAFVVALLALVIFTAIAGVFITASGGGLADIGRSLETEVTSFAGYFTPVQLLYQAFSAILQAVVFAVTLSPAAVIYAALTGHPVRH